MTHMTAYTIVNDPSEHPDRRLTLCGDGYFRSGISSGFGKSDTLVYKRLSAAAKRLRKVCKHSFPNAAILIHS